MLLYLPALFLSCVAYPFVHNRFIHPVGRMSARVQIGTSCEAVASEFARYARERGGPQAHFGRSAGTRSLFQTQDVQESEFLSIYDVSLFDDLQIRVRCDPDTGKVAERLVILD